MLSKYILKPVMVLITLTALFSTIVRASEPTKGPIFTDYGPVYDIKNRNVPLKKDFQYKVLFDISKTSKDEDQINKNIESVARFINMHVMNGIKLKNIEIAVVLHGKATRDGLTNEAYEKRYLSHNPTLDLIHQLSAKGVKFYQCGQSAYFQKIVTEDLDNNVGMALSAMTMLTELQAEGYQLIPWW